ncbi:MAG: ClpXP protease specificity-enhancing factor [Pseudomonadota bacterium]
MSTTVSPPTSQGTSTRPYLIRALHEWCTDNGFTPYVAVFVGAGVKVPDEYVKNNEIVLNIGYEATTGLLLGNEAIEFKARFGGVSREIHVPVDHVIAIYARENGQGMAFPVPAPHEVPAVGGKAGAGTAGTATASPEGGGLRLATSSSEEEREVAALEGTDPPPEGPGPGRPSLKRIK